MESYIKLLSQILHRGICSIVQAAPDHYVITIHKDNILTILTFLKKHSLFKFELLMDIFVVDYPKNKARFLLKYVLLSIKYNKRITIQVALSENDSPVSVSCLYESANWLEREVWDLNGIYFKYHKDLRRILTDYGFEGFPLRKDFPISGYVEIKYEDSKKCVIVQELETVQENRLYNLKGTWQPS